MKIWEDFTGAKKFNPATSKSSNTLVKKGTISTVTTATSKTNKQSDAKNQRSSNSNMSTVKDLN